MKTKIIEQYIVYTLNNNEVPSNVYQFAKLLNMEEQEFYKYFSGLESVEMGIFKNWFIETFDKCVADKLWANYSSREKVLSVFYAFIESVKSNRSFIVFLKKRDSRNMLKWPAYLKQLHIVFIEKMKDVINDGIATKEIAERKYLDTKYADGLWVNFLFVFNFWIDDTSEQFEKTDAAIEKSVNVSFDLMSKSALDGLLDLGKFMFQNR